MCLHETNKLLDYECFCPENTTAYLILIHRPYCVQIICLMLHTGLLCLYIMLITTKKIYITLPLNQFLCGRRSLHCSTMYFIYILCISKVSCYNRLNSNADNVFTNNNKLDKIQLSCCHCLISTHALNF